MPSRWSVRTLLRGKTPAQWVQVAAHAAAITAGLKFGFDFGRQVSGTLLGALMAVNAAVFCSIGVSTVAAVRRRKLRRPTEPG